MPSNRKRYGDRAAGCHQFITVSNPADFRSKDTLSRIRSGAMAAVGKARRKHGVKHNVVELNIPETQRCDEHPKIEPELPDTAVVPAQNVKPDPEVWLKHIRPGLLHLALFPVEPSRRARELIYFMHGEASVVYRPFRYVWFAMAMQDPTAFYLCLANASLLMHQHVVRQNNLKYTDSVESMKYYSTCLRQLARRLDDETQNTSDGVMTTIMGFVCIYSAAGQWGHSFLHMDGLDRIVRLRGGFKGLHHYVPLFATWFDLSHAAVNDQPPRFPLLESLQSSAASHEDLPPALCDLIRSLDGSIFELDHAIGGLKEVAHLASYVNKHCKLPNFWQSGLESTNLIRPAAHAALTIPRLSDLDYSLDNNTSYSRLLPRELVRLALLVFLAGLKKAFSLLAEELDLYIERFSAFTPLMAMVSCYPELRIWAAILVACVQKRPTPQRQIAELRRAMVEANVPTAEAAIQVARGLVWANALLDSTAERVQWEIENYESTAGMVR